MESLGGDLKVAMTVGFARFRIPDPLQRRRVCFFAAIECIVTCWVIACNALMLRYG